MMPEAAVPRPEEMMALIALGQDAAAALKRIARDERIKAYIRDNRLVHDALLGAARRFIGGETRDECAGTVERFNCAGHAVTIDFMGESTRDVREADEATGEFLRIIETIEQRELDASLSLDISHVGLAVDLELAFRNMSRIVRAAQAAGLEVMVSMEGSERTDEVLASYRRLSERFGQYVGITLQAYLHRTPADLTAMLDLPGKIRLVKGAFEEPDAVAPPRGEALDKRYLSLVMETIATGHPLSIATHDSAILEDVHRSIERDDLNREHIAFEMLKGITADRLEMMRRRGYRTRVYVPYGDEWYLYLCHRLAEYPPNIYRAISDAVMRFHHPEALG